FVLRVIGQNFASSSVVNLNASPRPTTYIDARNLSAQIPATDITSPRTINVTVTNPNLHLSNSVPLTVTNTPPKPTITLLNPNTVNATGPGFTLEIVGTNFASNSTAATGSPRSSTRNI